MEDTCLKNSKNLDKGLFIPLNDDEKNFETVVRPSVSYWQDAWRRLKENRVSLVCLIIVIVLILFAILIPILMKSMYGYTYQSNNLAITNQSPSAIHWFGTDGLGRDLLTRVACGTRYSLIIGVVAAIINLIVGVLYGGVSGFFGGFLDNVLMRIVDIIYSIPPLIYVVLLMAVFNTFKFANSGVIPIIVALSISYWVSMARIVRSDILQLKQQDFILAAKTLGASKGRILIRHLIPNCIGSIIVTTTMMVPSAIFTEAFLSFLGLGIKPPLASLGMLCNDAMSAIYLYPYQLFFPAIVICVLMIAFNMLGDGLTEALDPKQQK